MSGAISPEKVLLVSADLFLGSRVQGAVQIAGYPLDVASSPSAAIQRLESASYRLVLLDLETPGLNVDALTQLRETPNATLFVAYAPHVKNHLLESARAAGCDEVLSRGKFDATLPQLLDRFL